MDYVKSTFSTIKNKTKTIRRETRELRHILQAFIKRGINRKFTKVETIYIAPHVEDKVWALKRKVKDNKYCHNNAVPEIASIARDRVETHDIFPFGIEVLDRNKTKAGIAVR